MTVRKPAPPTNFRSPEPRTLEDLRKLVAYLREQNTYLEAQIAAGGGGGGGGVTSFNGRTGAVLPAAGDYTKSDVGLSNVTNDAQWSSTLSAQISALTAKAPLVDADVLPIEDSAASFAKKKVAVSDLRAFASSEAFPSNMWTRKPLTAGSLDDEFEYGASAAFGGSADLATRGWNVRNDAGGTMTRLGDVTIAYPNTLTNVQYRSTMTPGGLLIQSVFKMNVTKPVTGSWAFSCDVRANHIDTDTQYFVEAPRVYSVSPGVVNGTVNSVQIANYGGNRYGQTMLSGATYTNLTGSVSSAYPAAPWYGWLDWDSAAKNLRFLWAEPHSDRIRSPNMGVFNWAAFTLASAGFALITSRAWSNSWITLRSFRQLTQGKLPFIP